MKDKIELDSTDRAILKIIQQDATQSVEAIAAKVSVAPNTCWRRIKRMETKGVIRGRVALVDPARVGAGQVIFVLVRTRKHSKDWIDQFARVVTDIPEVVEFYRIAGEFDYIMKVVCTDVGHYDRVYKEIVDQLDLADINAAFAMECLKSTTALPV